MIAGFAAGLVVAVEGGPHRLSDQVSGVANGFLVPVFFVVLGASLNARALVNGSGVLNPGQGAAIIVAALASLAACAVGAGLAKRGEQVAGQR
jgi:Kef-type K+ transport system membrane component KefB